MLDKNSIQIIKDTVPFLQEKGTEITTIFYSNMFKAHPELLNIFNPNNQKKGLQQKALANTVLAAAQHIEDLSVLSQHVNQIGHKHRALQVKPEHYPIVGKYLLEAIGIVLGDNKSQKVLDAWEKAYGEIATIFINIETDMYKKATWAGFKPFKIFSLDSSSKDVIKIGLESENDIGFIEPGSYITINLKNPVDTYFSNRHYSVYDYDRIKKQLYIAVQLESEGNISSYLNKKINLDDTLHLSAPAGDFQLQKSTRQIFISSGIGVTAIYPLFKSALELGNNSIWIQNYKNKDSLILENEVNALPFEKDIYTNISSEDGRLNAESLMRILKNDFTGIFYICGSPEFTLGVKKILISNGVDDTMINYELFDVPKMSL